MNRIRGLRRGVAAPTYALMLGFVTLVGVTALATMGTHQGALSKDVAEAIGAGREVATAVNEPSSTSQDSILPAPLAKPTEKATKEREKERKEKVLFSETFDQPSILKSWPGKQGGLWQVRDGDLVNGQRRGWKPEQRIFVPGRPWEDQAVEVKVTLKSGWGYGVYVRAELDKQNRPSGVCFQYDPGVRPGAFLFREVDRGKETGIKALTWAPGFDFFGESHQIRIQVIGDDYSAFVDGKKVLEHTTKRYDKGTVGLRTWGDGSGQVAFHDLVVTRPGEDSEDQDQDQDEGKSKGKKKSGRHA